MSRIYTSTEIMQVGEKQVQNKPFHDTGDFLVDMLSFVAGHSIGIFRGNLIFQELSGFFKVFSSLHPHFVFAFFL